MARGRKKTVTLTREEQLENVNAEIDTCSETLKELRSRKKELERELAEEKKEEMYQTVLKSGKTIDEVLASLSNTEENE